MPILKLKLKYGEDPELLPPSLSVEGGRWCESRRVALDQGKAKLKLQATEGGGAINIRVVPLDKTGRQEQWIPEFLFAVDPSQAKSDKLLADKWIKVGKLSPAMPE